MWWEVLGRNQNSLSENISLSVWSHLRHRRGLSLLSRCTGFRADLRVVCLDVTLQVLHAFKLHPTFRTPQPGHGLLSLRVPKRGSSSSLVGALAIRAPDMIDNLICWTAQLLNKEFACLYVCCFVFKKQVELSHALKNVCTPFGKRQTAEITELSLNTKRP